LIFERLCIDIKSWNKDTENDEYITIFFESESIIIIDARFREATENENKNLKYDVILDIEAEKLVEKGQEDFSTNLDDKEDEEHPDETNGSHFKYFSFNQDIKEKNKNNSRVEYGVSQKIKKEDVLFCAYPEVISNAEFVDT